MSVLRSLVVIGLVLSLIGGLHSAKGRRKKGYKMVSLVPTNVTATAINSTAVQVEWQLPPVPEQDDNTGWRFHCQIRRLSIRYKKAGPNGRKSQRARVNPKETSVVISGLRPGRNYMVRVSATDCNGKRHQSKNVSFRTKPKNRKQKNGTGSRREKTEDELPGVPTSFQLRANSTTILATWGPPSTDVIVRRYVLHYGERFPQVEKTAPGDVREYTLTELRPGTNYVVRLQAENEKGFGRPINKIVKTLAMPDPTIGPDETKVPDAPTQLRVRTMTEEIVVTWTPPQGGALVRGYTIEYGEEVPNYSRTIDYKARSITLRNLRPGTQYVIRLRAFNQVGLSKAVYTLTYTRPVEGSTVKPMEPPVGLEAKPLSPTSIAVSWEDPVLGKSQKTLAGRSYEISFRTENSSTQSTLMVSDLRAVIDNLTPWTTYEVKVRSHQVTYSPWSVSAKVTTYETLPLTAPKNIEAVYNIETRCLDVTWDPPQIPNGPITGYLVVHTQLPEGNFTMTPTFTTNASLCPVRMKTEYTVSIRGRNNLGYGPLSSPLQIKTPLPKKTGKIALPPAPVNLTVTPGETWVGVTWAMPETQPPVVVRVFLLALRRGSLTKKQIRLNPTIRTYMFDNVEPGTRYHVELRAVNEIGRSRAIHGVVYTKNTLTTMGQTTELSTTSVEYTTKDSPVAEFTTYLPQTDSLKSKNLSSTNKQSNNISFSAVIHHYVTAAVSWSTPGCSSGESVFRLRYLKEGSQKWVVVEGKGKMALLSGLDPNSLYNVQVSTDGGASWSLPYKLMTK